MTKPSIFNFYERLQYMKKKRELKRALQRKPRPAKVTIPDEFVPLTKKDLEK